MIASPFLVEIAINHANASIFGAVVWHNPRKIFAEEVYLHPMWA